MSAAGTPRSGQSIIVEAIVIGAALALWFALYVWSVSNETRYRRRLTSASGRA